MNRKLKTGNYNPSFPIKNLIMANVNREIKASHAVKFKEKLNEFNWLMPIIISKNGNVIEGHHRIQSAILLKQNTLPAYIVDWVNVSDAKEHLNCIIGLNNGSLNWSMLDYLKAYINFNADYSWVYNKYLIFKKNITIGNIINLYFNNNRSGFKFKKGQSKIVNIDYSDWFLNKLATLNIKHGKKKLQSYCVREFIYLCRTHAKGNKKAVDYLFTKYDFMCKINHPALTSITEFKPILEMYLKEFKSK